VTLLGKFNQPVVAFIALIALLIATLNTNVAANVVSPSNDFSNLNPRLISFRTGGLITGVIGVLMMPWKCSRISAPTSSAGWWGTRDCSAPLPA
jgi:nucleobase:cation symporter-1, NCS1 family